MHSWDSFDFPLRGLPNRGYANVLRFGSVLAQGCVIPTRVLIAKKSTVACCCLLDLWGEGGVVIFMPPPYTQILTAPALVAPPTTCSALESAPRT